MIISYALQQFLFCGSEVHDRDRGAGEGCTLGGVLFVLRLGSYCWRLVDLLITISTNVSI